MRPAPLVAALALVSTLVAPRAAQARGVEPAIIGWSSDGQRFFYVTPPEDAGEHDEMGYGSATVQYGLVLDGRTGLVAERYLFSSSGKPTAEERAEWKALPNRAAWTALVKSARASCISARAPEAGVTAEVQVKGKHVKGAWKKSRFSFSSDVEDIGQEIKATLLFSVVRGGKSLLSAQTTSTGLSAGTLSGDVTLCWAPGGRRIAWVLKRSPGMMRDPGDYEVLVGPAVTPRIQLVADKGLLSDAATKIGALLEAAGFVSTSSKPSNETTPRPATVVYAALGFEAEAQRLAAAIPGGATVGKLDWKAPFDLIVGIGASALK